MERGVNAAGGVPGQGSTGIPRVRPVPMEKRFTYYRGPSSTGRTAEVVSPVVTSPDPKIDYNVVGLSYSALDERNNNDVVQRTSFEATRGPDTSSAGLTGGVSITPNNVSMKAATTTGSSARLSIGSKTVSTPEREKDCLNDLRTTLHHVDFIPNSAKSKKDDDVERFPALVERANQWSVQNPQCLVFSCETVTWTGVDRTIFTDSGVMLKSMNSDKKTKFLRGLRVWYFVSDDTFYDKSTSPGPFKLGSINYTLEGKADTLLSLLAKINGDMFKRSVAGKILKIETLVMNSDVSDCDVSAWAEQPDKARDYVTFIRLFYVFKKEGMEDCKYGDIGFHDFIPFYDQRTPLNQGYEVFSELWSKASRWMHLNQHLSFINAQGIFVKVKKDSQPVSLWDRCNHREHGSAYGSLTHQKTEYFQILRIIYHQPPSPSGAGSVGASGSSGESEEITVGRRKLYYKTFTPSPLQRAVTSSGGSDEQETPAPIEGLYEDLRQLEEKTNAWLTFFKSNVTNVETVPTRLMSGNQEMLGPESTFVYNDRERNQLKEIWRVNIRLYVDSEFKEPAPTWISEVQERKSITSIGGQSALQTVK